MSRLSSEKKEKHISYNSAYLATAFIQKPPPVLPLSVATSDIRKCYMPCTIGG